MNKFSVFSGITIILFCVISINTAFANEKIENIPYIQNGILDLRNWDFNTSKSVNLKGEWAFSWNKYEDPLIFPSENGSSKTTKIPGYWNSYIVDGKRVGATGHATYGLVILLPENYKALSISLKNIQTAWVLYVNGKRVDSLGKIGTSKDDSSPHEAVRIINLPPDKSLVRLTIHTSNYHHRDGGMWETSKIGIEENIRTNYELSILIDIFLFAFILAMGIFYLIMFFTRKKDLTSLFFALFCIFIALRAVTVSNINHESFMPFLKWPILKKIEYFSFYAALPCFLTYLYTVFPREFSRPILRAFLIACGIPALIVIVTPPIIFEYTLQAVQIFTVIGGVYSTIVLIKAVRLRRSGAIILLCGFLILFILVINDVLYANQIIHTGHILPWGQIVFLMSQAYMISHMSGEMFHIIEIQNIQLKKNSEIIAESRLGIILGLAKLAESRDEDTGTHLERIREYCRLLATHLAELDEYRNYITNEYIMDLFDSSVLHDIGKVGIPDSVLLKPGQLTPEEYQIIKKHTLLGGNVIRNVEETMSEQSFLTLGKEIAYSHHEKWDGSGYPQGLKGEQIPLSARIVALADVYDALTSKRPYKKAFSHEKAVLIITEGSGVHFDPTIVSTFKNIESEFKKIKDAWQETS
ncbi:MAG: 7TM diverse intracellular signaling domain-containing protein [Spirochaetales bacterium]|nr:7TM diverse intracellular signaling domain-containing protein [Spirochaetales bacterium]